MIRPTASRRPGLTLIEAMIALGVAAVGMICLLTLFPLGALQMGQALKDERTSQAAIQADTKVRLYWKGLLDKTVTDSGTPNSLMAAFSDPSNSNQTVGQGTPPVLASNPGNIEPSYPVFLDPIGVATWSGTAAMRDQVAKLPQLPRRSFAGWNFTSGSSTSSVVRFAGLLDDLSYNEGGVATLVDPTTNTPLSPEIERQGRYNWLAVVQRPDNSNPSVADLKIVVFDGRAPGFPDPGSEMIFDKNNNTGSQDVMLTPGATSLTLFFSGARPAVTKGRWIMDATLTDIKNSSRTFRVANFYRVVSVNDETPGQLDIELQTPIKPMRDPSGNAGANANAYSGTIVILNGVAEVFDRPQLTQN